MLYYSRVYIEYYDIMKAVSMYLFYIILKFLLGISERWSLIDIDIEMTQSMTHGLYNV